MDRKRQQTLLRAFVETYPPLKLALWANDVICYCVKSIRDCLWSIIKFLTRPVIQLISELGDRIKDYVAALPVVGRQAAYRRLEKKRPATYRGPVPYGDDPLRMALTYHGGLVLGVLLYIFVYYVLIKHHSVATISIACSFFLVYMIVLENSHCLRSILMLCLPIMFTNRGRALIFCSMLTILIMGPVRNSQANINELHTSLNCSQQYLIVKADRYIDEKAIQGIVKVEDVIYGFIDDLRAYIAQLRAKFQLILQLALSIESYISAAIEKLKEIIDVCNSHGQNLYLNCTSNFEYAYLDCRARLGSITEGLCELVRPVSNVCEFNKLPDVLCEIPKSIIRYLDQTIGERLRSYAKMVEKELYFDVDLKHNYSYHESRSKSFTKVASEIKYDIERKFHYIYVISRVFNIISLVLVIWIILVATTYHMHFLDDIKYDNMYLDEHLRNVERKRMLNQNRQSFHSPPSNESLESQSNQLADESMSDEGSLEDFASQQKDKYLFPLTSAHENRYLSSFSPRMNETEKSKLRTSSLIWLIIVGYVAFFTLSDYALYELLVNVNELLRDILFKSDLPVIDLSTQQGDHVVHYNRTYLHQISNMRRKTHLIEAHHNMNRTGSLSSMYRNLMDSLEKNIPDDVTILDSMETCLPHPKQPDFEQYKTLLYLATLTFVLVIFEAYAMRTRHCIANLFYPDRAKLRAVWLYSNMLAERTSIDQHNNQQERNSTKPDLFDLGLKVLQARVRR